MRLFNPFQLSEQPDSSADLRPVKRSHLFYRVFRDEWPCLITLSLFYTLVYLPALIWLFLNFLLLEHHFYEGNLSLDSHWLFQFLLILSCCIAISGPGAAALSRCSRNLARGQHRPLLSTMWDALRSGWKQGLFCSVLSALLPLLCYFSSVYFLSFPNSPLMLAAFCVFLLVLLYGTILLPSLWVMIPTYDLPISSMIANANYMTLRQFGKALSIRILASLPELFGFFLCLTNPLSVNLVFSIVAAYYIFFGFGLRSLLLSSFGNFLCETYLNPKIPGSWVDIGLSSERQIPIIED